MDTPREPHARAVRPEAQAVLDVLLGCAAWVPFRGPSGAALWRVPGSDGAEYVVNRASCTCTWSTYHPDSDCKHRAALAAYRRVVVVALKRHAPSLPMDAGPSSPPRETPDSVA